jgi:carbamoyl-phosphate synthase small subunit
MQSAVARCNRQGLLESAVSSKSSPPAVLVLADGTIFKGTAVGSLDANGGAAVGEVVFNTAMTGYQEILTDPSWGRSLP